MNVSGIWCARILTRTLRCRRRRSSSSRIGAEDTCSFPPIMTRVNEMSTKSNFGRLFLAGLWKRIRSHFQSAHPFDGDRVQARRGLRHRAEVTSRRRRHAALLLHDRQGHPIRLHLHGASFRLPLHSRQSYHGLLPPMCT